mgnify:CR=1 FL=1
MKVVERILLATSILVLAGCTTFTDFTKTGDVSAVARPQNCDFNIYTTQPKHEYDELGVIDLTPVMCVFCPNKASNVRDIVQEDVCLAGGNAILLWEANGYGVYQKTTVISIK